MKKIISILVCLFPLFVAAQIVEPVKWSGEEFGDSVRLKAVIEPGFHMNIIEFGEREYAEEFADSFVVTVAKAELTPIRYNACDDKMCTAPEVGEYKSTDRVADRAQNTDRNTDAKSLIWIFVLGFLGGLLAIFTPCVWPIIPMTVSFFLKKGGGKRDAILYGLSIIILYVGLGLLVTVLFGASALNDLSTNAVVNIYFFVLLVVFALSFFGLFEITLPDSWSTALDSKARSTGGFLSILLMAFTLVIVSFSFTGRASRPMALRTQSGVNSPMRGRSPVRRPLTATDDGTIPRINSSTTGWPSSITSTSFAPSLTICAISASGSGYCVTRRIEQPMDGS